MPLVVFFVNEDMAFCCPLTLHKFRGRTKLREVRELHAPVAYFGDLSQMIREIKSSLSPRLLLRNVSANDLTASVSVYGKRANGLNIDCQLKPVRIAPQCSIEIDLQKQRTDAKWDLKDGPAGVRVVHDSESDGLIAEVVSIGRKGGIAWYDPVRNLAFHNGEEQVGISFNLDEDRESFLIIRNTTGDRPCLKGQ